MRKTIHQYLTSPDFQGLAPATKKMYEAPLNLFQAFLDGNQDVREREQALIAFAANLEASNKLSGQTIQQYMTVVKIYLKWAGTPAVYSYKIPSDQKKAHRLKKMNRWFVEEDIEACLNYQFSSNHIRNHLLVRLLVETGARVREISSMELSDVELGNNLIWIRKSKTEPRPAFFSPETSLCLGRYLPTIQPGLFKCPPPLFPTAGQVQRIINDMLSDLGMKKIKDGRGCHTFRHYCATHLFYVGGMGLNDIATLLGDAPETIRSTYLHPTPKMLYKRVKQAMGW